MARRRLFKELQAIMEDENLQTYLTVSVEKDIYEWQAIMKGPPNTPYADGEFELEIIFNKQFPHHPPKLRFLTSIYHMNVHSKGSICMATLLDEWAIDIEMSDLFEGIYKLLSEPDPTASVDDDICALYVSKRDTHDENARNWTLQFAMANNNNNNNNNQEKKPNENDGNDEDEKNTETEK